MKTAEQYLDAAKAAAQLPSDYALAKALGMTQSSLSVLRTRGATFSDQTALKVADILGIDAAEVLLDVHAQRATDENERRVWQTLRKQLGNLGKKAACALLASAALGGAQPNEVQAKTGSNALPHPVYYVKS